MRGGIPKPLGASLSEHSLIDALRSGKRRSSIEMSLIGSVEEF